MIRELYYTPTMPGFTSREEFLDYLEKSSLLPEGFLCSTASLEFYPAEKPVSDPFRMNLSLLLAEEETPYFAAMFTKNRFPGAPVIIGREMLSGSTARGILINNKISNVCASNGKDDALELLAAVAGAIGVRGASLFPASTGIIGWKLPLREMKAAIPELVENLGKRSILDVATAIMTTDSYPKVRCARAGDGIIAGIAKGAGMIEPNLATMLAFIVTDLEVQRNVMEEALRRCVHRSFNRISIDSDQSTSDSVILIGSGKKRLRGIGAFEEGLSLVCEGLAADIVRSGEGTSHVMRVTVRGNSEERILEGIGKAIVNSPLVKTAIYGNDPNVGRIVSSIGDYLGNREIPLDTGAFVIRMGGREIFSDGTFRIDSASERYLGEYICAAMLEDTKKKGYPAHELFVDLEVETGGNMHEVTIYGSDLSLGYVEENADYRT
jgi:glutamate N-acetyltransferase/amino-acid N-acetyltransferase